VDLVIIFLLTIICFPVVTLTEGVLRIILGIVFLLIFPGYTMIAAIFPNKNSITGIQRAGFTIISSVALVSLVGLVLNFTPWGIRLTPIYITTSIIIVLGSGIALFRRSGLPVAERFSIPLTVRMPKWGKSNKFDRAISICLAIVVIGAVTTLGYVIVQPKAQEAFTDFYILGPGGKMEDYPQGVTLGEQMVVTVGIENHENQDTNYNIKVTLDGVEMQSMSPVSLSNEGKWSSDVTLTPTNVGDNQKVEFFLYKGEESAPYLSLHLWLNVKE
jgi:uncharacterized membrane protein